jgi:YVTN family beta-propeller protein
MTKIDNYFFLAINNSNMIVVIDANTYKLVSTIAIPQPRYILVVGSNKAYVSSLYGNTLYIINTQTYSVTGSITLPSKNPEGMCLYNNTAIITSWDTTNRYIYLVDIATDKIVENVRVAGLAPQEVFIDKDQLLWVLSGDQTDGKTAALTRIDLSTGAILDSFIFSKMADPIKPVLNNTKDSIYFIENPFNNVVANNGVYRMSIYDKQLPIRPFIAGTQYQSLYALGIDPVIGDIYVGDPKGFIQKGTIYIYKPDGTLTNQFNAGLGPGHFYFDL